ncbi:MAG: putative Ig domain-containing protein [Methylococcaceae bacterium]|nr:putative Ig domain-containing protein [Methylococcaceae bacterium]
MKSLLNLLLAVVALMVALPASAATYAASPGTPIVLTAKAGAFSDTINITVTAAGNYDFTALGQVHYGCNAMTCVSPALRQTFITVVSAGEVRDAMGALVATLVSGIYQAPSPGYAGMTPPPPVSLLSANGIYLQPGVYVATVYANAVMMSSYSLNQYSFKVTPSAATGALPPTLSTASLPNGAIGSLYSTPVSASAPNGDPITVTVTGLPAGLTFDGVNISGTPTSVGTSSVTITVKDTATLLSTSATLPLTINDAAISFTPTLPDGVTNSAYSAPLSAATGGSGGFTYTATGLPTGITLTGNVIWGTTPSVAGAYPITLTATDSAGFAQSATVTLNVVAPVPVACSGTNAVETAWVARSAGSFIVVNGGLNLLDHLWTINLNPTNTQFLGGLLNWYKAGLILDYTGTVDPYGCILTHLTVKPGVTLDTASLPNGTAGLAYTAPISVSWGIAPYKVTVSGLPAGLVFDGINITGIPTVTGPHSVIVTAVDSAGVSASKTLVLQIDAQATTFSPTLPGGTVGAGYSANLTATGFGPFTFAATGLPAGLTLTGSTVGGTPTAAGTFTVSLTATDAAGITATVSTTLIVNPAPAPSNFTVKDESTGKITAIGADYLMVGAKKLIWGINTKLIVNTPDGALSVVGGFVQVGMNAQWKGLRDQSTNTVLTSKLEIN